MSALSEENGSIARRARAAAQPYVRRRPRRSQRLGHQPNKTDNLDENDHDDEDDMVLNGSQKEETPAAARGGLFSRLFSFFPLGGSKKTMPEVEEPTLHDAPLASTHSEQEDDKPELETSQESLDTVMEVAVKSPVTEIATVNGHTASPVKTTRSPPSKRSSPSKRMSTAKTKATEKKPASPAAVSSVFGHGTEKTKSLKIVNGDAEKEPFAFQRLTGRRRNKPSSPRVAESPLAVIKKKKPISFEEYERLSSQLRNLVETTPENALALTRSTLSNAFESRGSSDVGAVSDGRDRRELSVAALPSVKRARPSEDLPITLPREDRLSRKPKPSRLLTGTKRDAAARSAYSAAVAEKILSTLNKIQTPLDKESQKPTPSTSLSWAKYQIALTKQDTSNQDGDTIMGADDEDAPPTMSIPKVAVTPVEAEMPATTVAAIAKNPVFSFSQPAAIVQPTPVPEVKKSITPTDETRKLSTEAVKPKPVAQNGSAFAPALSTKQKMGHYAFTIPVAATTTSSKHSDDDSIQYIFTPPPALREPPKRSPGQKSLSSKAAVTTAPFAFMPSSPRVRPESLTKSVPPKVKSPEMSSTPAVESPAPLKSATNPLARFMQSDAGSWRCPTCAVMNGANQAKCPCCETSKPSSVSSVTESSTPKATTSMSSTSAGTNPLARFMQMEPGSWKCPSCAVTNGPKYSKCPCCDTDMPGNVSNVKASQPNPSSASAPSSSGFKFGVASSESKKADTTESMTSGFNFGSNTQNTQATATPGFSFGVPSQTSTTTAPGSGGFTFGVASTSASTSDSEKPKSAPTSSSAELTKSHKRKTSDEGAREGSEKKPAASSTLASPSQKTTGGFTLGSAATSTVLSFTEGTTQSSSTFGSTSTTPDSGKKAFSFGSGVASAPKPTVPSFGATQEKKDTPSFTFGASSAKPVEAAVTEAKPSFTLGESSVKPKDMGSEPKSSFMFGAAKSFEGNSTDGAKTSFTFTASSVKPSEEKSADSNPSFTFGGTSVKPSEVKSAESMPSFTFGASTVTEVKATDSTPPKSTFSMPSTNDTALAEKKPSFTFGASAATAPSKPAFSFGSTTSEANPSVSFGTGSSTMSTNVTTPSAPAFTFGGASSDSSSKKADAPAFTFGGVSTGGATSTFGADKVPSSGFGQSAPFGSSASVTSGFGVSSTSFGSTPSTSIGFGSSTSMGFGSSATTAATSSGFGPATSTGFGSATSSGFGSATSSGFGANTSSGFGTTGATSFGTTTTSTAFGSTPASTPSFGATPASTPGAPVFSFGASTPATSQPAFVFSAPSASSAFTTPTTSGFGSNSHTPGFGSAPTSGGFGSAPPSTGFGMNSTPAFGSTPTPSAGFGAAANGSGFGGNGFGPGAPTSTGFGVPTPTPSPAFGGSSATFGTPSSAFGTPGSAFGATPSPAPAGFGAPSPVFGAPATQAFGAPPTPSFGTPAGGFGGTPGFGGPQPATDGFSMGSAPPKGRRILKAKPRPKRT